MSDLQAASARRLGASMSTLGGVVVMFDGGGNTGAFVASHIGLTHTLPPPPGACLQSRPAAHAQEMVFPQPSRKSPHVFRNAAHVFGTHGGTPPSAGPPPSAMHAHAAGVPPVIAVHGIAVVQRVTPTPSRFACAQKPAKDEEQRPAGEQSFGELW